MATQETWRQWIRMQNSYTPDLEYSKAIGDALKDFEATLLAEDTAVWSVSGRPEVQSRELDLSQLATFLDHSDTGRSLYRFFFVGRFRVVETTAENKADAHKLRISAEALRLLASRLYMSPSFLFALSRYYLPNGHTVRRYEHNDGATSWSQWYFLPVRVQVACTDPRGNHEQTQAGRNQMNPFHYLHLPDEKVDLRGTQIAVYLFHDGRERSTNIISFNFLHGKYRKVVEEPQQRMAEALGHQNVPEDPMFVHLVFLTTVVRLWNNALHSYNEQLIAYERQLQEEVAVTNDTNAFHSRLSKALHAMAAHSQRYCAELDSLERTTGEIGKAFSVIYGHDNPSLAGIDHVKGQLGSTTALVQELEKKTQNILALLFNRMQIANDQLMVSNGRSMHAIMQATQLEAAFSRDIAMRSQKLAEATKKDSVSMKTIAILTMFFLPATSFAALLAMPFFSQNSYLGDDHQVWIWFALTVPTTGVAFAFYHWWRKHEETKESGKSPDLEMNGLGSAGPNR